MPAFIITILVKLMVFKNPLILQIPIPFVVSSVLLTKKVKKNELRN